MYCDRTPGEQLGALVLEHVLPRARGGNDSAENTAMACAFCNRFKSDRTPLEWVWQRAKAWPPEVHDRYWRYPVLGKPGKSRWVGFPLRMPPDVRAEVDRIAEADLTRPALNTVFLRLIRAGLDARDASAPDVDAET